MKKQKNKKTEKVLSTAKVMDSKPTNVQKNVQKKKSRFFIPKFKISRESLNPKNIIINAKAFFVDAFDTSKYIVSFAFLLTLYLLHKALKVFETIPFIPHPIKKSITGLVDPVLKKMIAFSRRSERTVNRMNLIDLALRNMGYKKSRTLITIGGMSVGIAAIVFLVSVGFGLQDLVVGRVARLEELRQADVSVQTGSKLVLDDATINSIKDIPGVEDVQPVIAVVGRVSLNESIFDVAVFGVTSDYLQSSAIKPVRGRIFDSNDLSTKVGGLPDGRKGIHEGFVAGEADERVYSEYGTKIQDVDFVVDQESWVPVYSDHSNRSKLLGYTRRVVGAQLGEEYWGDSYVSDDGAGSAAYTVDLEPLGKWVKSTFKVWEKQICLISENPDCEENQFVVVREDEENLESAQVEVLGYIHEKDISVRGTYNLDTAEAVLDDEVKVGDVLGEATDSAELDESSGVDEDGKETDSSKFSNELLAELDLDASSAALLEIEGLLATGSATTEEVKEIPLDKSAVKEAIVNRAMLPLLGFEESEAVGETFTTSFVVVGSLAEGNEKIQSKPVEYKIVGIDPSNETPFFYVPFIDVRTLGVSNYSQLKVVSDNDEVLPDIRNQISVLGYSTSSVVDTVERITDFFGTLRIVLALVGGVALAVASLGMFNTLTVSLLERTREVGLMKAMGMKSFEVRELFLTESMIMGFFGGFFGIVIGIGSGKLLSFGLSAFALSQGQGVVNISSTPVIFVILTMLFALFVGLVTGIFPARRATKISALDALRYE